MPVGLLARLQVKAEQVAAFEKAFGEYQRKVRALEQGNLFFHLHRARDKVGSYTVIEQYQDDAALAVHRSTEHYKAIPSMFASFMAGPPDIQVLDSVDS